MYITYLIYQLNMIHRKTWIYTNELSDDQSKKKNQKNSMCMRAKTEQSKQLLTLR